MSFAYSDELLAELMAAFSTEAEEQLQALNEGLLALERGDVGDAEAERELLREIFRHAHTLKGGAAAVDLSDVRELSHHLESLFGLLQSGDFEPDGGDFDTLYRVLDAIGVLIESGAKGEETAFVDVAGLSRELESLLRTPRGEGGAAGSAGTSGPDEGRRLGALPDPAPRVQGSEREEPPEQASADPSGSVEEVVRISTSKLDALMSDVGELIVARNAAGRGLLDLRGVAEEIGALEHTWRRTRRLRRRMIASVDGHRPDAGPADAELLTLLDAIESELHVGLSRLEGAVGSLSDATRRSDQIIAALHSDMRAARMLPLQSILASFPRMVRDLARQQGKEVVLDVEGADTELDRAVLEQIKAPLIHLLRNCVDHGLEEPAVRVAAGKSEHGTIVLSAVQEGDSVRIEIADDGRGIDPSAVKAAAVAKGSISADEAGRLGRIEALGLVFRSGLSTSRIVSDVSGRGVGLDVVRENVERLGGRVQVDSTHGEGTRFSLILPLTVSITRCLLVRSGSHQFAVPINNTVRVVRVTADDVHDVEGGRAIKVEGDPVVLTDLVDELHIASEDVARASRPALVVRPGEGSIALCVDEVMRVEDLVVKALPRRLAGTPNLTGAAILDTGRVVLVLNIADVARSGRPAPVRRTVPTAAGDEPEQERKLILLADDSLTTRTLEKNILEATGYEVRAVGDGDAAWDVLQADGAHLLVSDVQMPKMDGFELTEKIREDARFQDLPVVLVTSLDSPADRRRGMEAGADAYIVKSGFDQEHLIDVIARLI